MLYSKYLIVILLILSLSLTGCGKKLSRGEYLDMRYDAKEEGLRICNEKAMEFLYADIKDFDDIEAVCLTTSPLKMYRYDIEI